MAPMASIEDLMLISKSEKKRFLREKGQNAILYRVRGAEK